jgi:hypothetical protein
MTLSRDVSDQREIRVCALVAASALLGAGIAVAPAQADSGSGPPTESSPAVAAPATDTTPPITAGSPRGDIVYSPGVPVRGVSLSKRSSLVIGRIYWNQPMISRPGRMDRFIVRLVALGSGGATFRVLSSRTPPRSRHGFGQRTSNQTFHPVDISNICSIYPDKV